ncbi:MAG: FMN-binding negative transcriptional regulator [Pedobacter sp.]|nr:MAG: FMN-binding negative transcriptional regulator [Pedobacter sp.]
MYIPNINRTEDKEEILEFIQRFSFGLIITANNNEPVGTHLPFLASERDGKIILKSHFAKANKHWEQIADNKVLVIFTEPHAYVSPANYDSEINVPTWNYISVHTYGKGKILAGQKAVFDVLEETIQNYESGYKQQWDHLPNDYKLKLSKGIIAFEIEVSEIQAKKKLSQNKTTIEQKNIIETLSKGDSNEQHIAEYMIKNLA